MPAAAPEGAPAPLSGELPAAVLAAAPTSWSAYVHVPFCATRCGYCDFNTYTADELGGGINSKTYPEFVAREIELAARVLGGHRGPLHSVFFGGGTPSLLSAAAVAGLLGRLRSTFGFLSDAEITLEANPESVSVTQFAALAEAGVTRVSLGMQSAVAHVLAALDRTHRPERVAQAVSEARAAGIGQISLDLIYGSPGETDTDWLRSLHAALDLSPDHVSAYALTVEEGTRLAARIRRGELAHVDDDVLADRYLIAEETLSAAGYSWYEVSNWARTPAARCRHNLAYWTGGDWWGFGPGAHSHVGGLRWWNLRHPSAYAARVERGQSPAQARELLDEATRKFEEVMLEVRLADGWSLRPGARPLAARLAADGLIEPDQLRAGRVVLALRGRLLADAVVRALTG